MAIDITKPISKVTVDGNNIPLYHNLQSKTVTPTTSQQTITPDSGNDGLSSVTVDGVTSAIDTNIKPTNIREGVQILGVTGTVIEADPLTDVYYAQQQDLLKSINGIRVYNENDYNEGAMQRLRALLTNMTGVA